VVQVTSGTPKGGGVDRDGRHGLLLSALRGLSSGDNRRLGTLVFKDECGMEMRTGISGTKKAFARGVVKEAGVFVRQYLII
jgi:hypothetical protein